MNCWQRDMLQQHTWPGVLLTPAGGFLCLLLNLSGPSGRLRALFSQIEVSATGVRLAGGSTTL